MKRILFLIVCILSFSDIYLAQSTETFDIATFQPPAGWKKQTKPGAVIFTTTNDQKGAYAMITVYASNAGSGDTKSDFDSDWQELIAVQLGIKGKPEIEPIANADGWDVVTGGAGFENELGPAAVLLSTHSGYGRKFSMAAIFNSQDYSPAIEAFASSVKLKKPDPNVRPSAANDNTNASILGTWGITASDQSSWRVQNAVMSYISRQYTFNADGSYLFFTKTYDPLMDKMLLGRENGTYQISGNNLTINPKTSVIEAWSKNQGRDEWGKRINSQAQPLEKVTYQFTKHYFSGIQTWSLVMQFGKTTQRDGPFSGGNAFANAWIYSPPCAQCFIELPR